MAAVVVVVLVVVVELGAEEVVVVGPVVVVVLGFDETGPCTTGGRTPGSSGPVSSWPAVLVAFAAGVDFEVEVELAGLVAAGFGAAGLDPAAGVGAGG